jgi:hypothetical protein
LRSAIANPSVVQSPTWSAAHHADPIASAMTVDGVVGPLEDRDHDGHPGDDRRHDAQQHEQDPAPQQEHGGSDEVETAAGIGRREPLRVAERDERIPLDNLPVEVRAGLYGVEDRRAQLAPDAVAGRLGQPPRDRVDVAVGERRGGRGHARGPLLSPVTAASSVPHSVSNRSRSARPVAVISSYLRGGDSCVFHSLVSSSCFSRRRSTG